MTLENSEAFLRAADIEAETPITAGAGGLDTAWLIESENQMYIGTSGVLGVYVQWTPDVNAALRFAPREDAEAMIEVCKRMGIGFHNDAKGATEHGWYQT